MKVRVDRNLCSGHGRCYVLSPEVYGEDEDGYCVIAEPDVPEALKEAARRGAENCPEQAISVED